MGIITSRQIRFGTASVPQIEYDDAPNISGYDSIPKVLGVAIYEKIGTSRLIPVIDEQVKKICEEYIIKEKKQYEDCIIQTINYLKKIKAVKPMTWELKTLHLWKSFIDLGPFYEGIASELSSMLIKKHYPRMSSEMAKGAIMSHQGLTNINECITYTMEYFLKEQLLINQNEVIKGLENGK